METIQITLENGNRANAVVAIRTEKYGEILKALSIPQPNSLFIVIGGANNLDESTKATLLPLFSNGIAATAAEIGAVILDGGTRSGIMELMGQGVAEQEHQPLLLGVAPEGKVRYRSQPTQGIDEGKTPLDPHHSHFILVKGDQWGDETSTMFGIAHELADQSPVVTVLASGGDVAKQEVLQSVQRGWPILVITGTGQLADTLAGWRRKQATPSFLQRVLRRGNTSLKISDRDIADIITSGDIYLFPGKGRVEQLCAMLNYLFLKQEKRVLAQINERETLYDQMAGEHQKVFKQLQFWILLLGVCATALALGQTQLQAFGWLKANTIQEQLFHFFVILVPILVTVLLGITTYFKWGNKWVLLRSSREAIKQELFRFRTHTGMYQISQEKAATKDHQKAKKSAEQILVDKVAVISQRLIQTELSTSTPTSPVVPRLPKFRSEDEDDGFRDLSPDEYIKFRLDDQLAYYRLKAGEWNRKLKVSQSLIIIASGLGALLAAINLALWLPLATAIGAAFALYLEYMQVVNTLTKYNQAATNLEDVKQWWTALPESEKTVHESCNKLVEATEKILESEQESWVQHMQNAIDKLYKKDATNSRNDDDHKNE